MVPMGELPNIFCPSQGEDDTYRQSCQRFVISNISQDVWERLTRHLSLLGNDSSFQPVPGFDPGHTMGTGEQEPTGPALRSTLLVLPNVAPTSSNIGSLLQNSTLGLLLLPNVQILFGRHFDPFASHLPGTSLVGFNYLVEPKCLF
ncbi:hypothetical protein DSO57_1014900 [Entomophthora muscae]|uniref:Uncharacterized protein n=1 Tax=Entomophthora muscae TaxID=34485 RepID=A0ACC2SI34_9FUNG|nr:hypothetical protein DSO57_1014900 [Entomophthora muscae]